MGDVRYDIHLERLHGAVDRARTIHEMDDEAVVSALGAASKANEPLLANVLTTEILNRMADKNRIISNLGEGVFRLRADGSVAFLNDAAASMLEMTDAEIMGRDLHDVIHVQLDGNRLAREQCAILGVLASGAALSLDREEFRAKSGKIFPVDCTATPVIRDGEIEGVVVIFRDVTERERIAAELRASERRHRDLFEEAPHAYFEVGLDEQVLSANKAAHEMLGYDPGGLVGMSVFDLHPADGPGLVRAQEIFDRFASGAEVLNEEIEMVRADGAPVWVSLSMKPLTDTGDRSVKARSVCVDVTARRRADERLRELADFVRFNPSPVFRIGADGTILDANPAAYDFFADDLLVGKRWTAVCPEGAAVFRDVLENGGQRIEFMERNGTRLALTYRSLPRGGTVYVYGFAGCGQAD